MRSLLLACLFLFLPAWAQRAPSDDYLSDEEEGKVREAQDPSQRIEVYLEFARARLDRVDDFRSQPQDPKYDNGAYLDKLLVQYISITDDLKNWIEDHYERQNDMRAGLRKLLESGPEQLNLLRRIQQTPDPYTADYSRSLREAIDDLTDTLDGATKALGDQVRMFGELKREAKVEAKAAKERAKDEKKREKEEKKLRKRMHKRGVPADTDED